MRLKIVAGAVVLAIGAGIGLTVWLRNRTPVVAQEILREAAAEGKRSLGKSAEPLVEIFNQQATQGYYDDAMATARLWGADAPSQHRLVVNLMWIRAENGDIQGARNMAASLTAPQTKAWAIDAIAEVQAHRGDLRGALETSALLPGQSPGCHVTVTVAGIEIKDPLPGAVRAIEAYAVHQLNSYDIEGAITTAAEVRPCSTPDLLTRLAYAFFEQGRKVRNMVSPIANRKVAAEFLAMVDERGRAQGVKVYELNPCDTARFEAQIGRFADAYHAIDHTTCLVSDVAVKQYPTDPTAAEKALRRSTNRDDLALGMAGFSRAAAKKGDVAGALRFLTAAEVAGADADAWPKTDVVRDVAWVWTIKEGPRPALRWARSRPAGSERASALLGVAQALAHPRPRPTP